MLETTTVWPSSFSQYLAKMRQFRSVSPPAPAGTTRVTGFVGQFVAGLSEAGVWAAGA